MSRCYAYIVAYISRLEIGNVVLRPARLEVGHYDMPPPDSCVRRCNLRTEWLVPSYLGTVHLMHNDR